MLVTTNVAVFFSICSPQRQMQATVSQFGLVSHHLVVEPHLGSIVTPVTSMFLHASAWSLLFDMAILGVYGTALEVTMPRRRLVGLYLLCGLAGEAGHVLLLPTSKVPLIGTAGPVAGVMGAYVALTVMRYRRGELRTKSLQVVLSALAAAVLSFSIVQAVVNALLLDAIEPTTSHVAAVGFIAGLVLLPVLSSTTTTALDGGTDDRQRRPPGDLDPP